nr:transposase family protein [Streptomyces sp. 3211]
MQKHCWSTSADLTMRQLAPLFGVSRATVCRVIQRLRLLLAR